MQAAILGYSQIREYEDGEKVNHVIEAIYKAITAMVKALAGRRRR